MKILTLTIILAFVALAGMGQHKLTPKTAFSVTTSRTNPVLLALLARDINHKWLRFSAPDSTGKYTVTFSKSVRFINDTTFTFKLNTKNR